MADKLLISACLLGEKVKYDGGHNFLKSDELLRLKNEGRLVPVCPEVLAGFSTPRPPVEISGSGDEVTSGNAKVRRENGEDVTPSFIEGAKRALDIAKESGVKVALLKERSPSCGVLEIYDGSFSKKTVKGSGVTTALLRQNGVLVFSEDELQNALSSLE